MDGAKSVTDTVVHRKVIMQRGAVRGAKRGREVAWTAFG